MINKAKIALLLIRISCSGLDRDKISKLLNIPNTESNRQQGPVLCECEERRKLQEKKIEP